MKKVMMLGATPSSIQFVKSAHEIGVAVVAVDMSETSAAKKIADKAYTQSTADIDKLVEIAKNEQIDGVVTGYDDFNTGIAVELCQRLGLPFYASGEQINVTKNKIGFKRLCEKFDIPVVREYSVQDICFPCVVKPADSYSAKGISICRSKEMLDELIEQALSFSKTKQFLIEKYMAPEKVDCVNIDYVLRNEEIKVSCIGDKKVIKQGDKAPITSAVVYPSVHQEEFLETVDKKCQAMFKHLGMKDGTLFIECFYDEEGFHIYEMGYRVGGGQSSVLLNRIMDVDYLKLLINFAISGRMCNDATWNRIDPRFTESACGLLSVVKSGKIAEIIGLEEIAAIPEVINTTQYLHVGDVVDDRLIGTLGQSFARFHIVAESRNRMRTVLQKIRSVLKVISSNGENMVLPLYQDIDSE